MNEQRMLYGSFSRRTALLNQLFTFRFVHILCFAVGERFVNFDFALYFFKSSIL
ncbi:MAG: hypothetical protein LUM44_21170 [Pyrinomonadaceae bacterium]|nr:hypothetical protein [Pyrinomonadaceae bacterium]